MKKNRPYMHLFTGLLVGLGLALGPAAKAQEGWDPMRQIQHQIITPNLMVVLDCSGSMAWDTNGSSVGVNSTGSVSTSWSVSTSSKGCGNNKYKFTYKLNVNATLPSRMCIVKNALGNSVSLTYWKPPTTWPDYSGWTYLGNNSWQSDCTTKDPGQPFDPSVYVVTVAPADVIGNSASTINWGLVTFHGACNIGSCSSGACVRVAVNPANNTSAVSSIEGYLQLSGTGNGLGASSSTPTRAGLSEAGSSLLNTFNSDSRNTCGRIYGAVLVTDGQSNNCNAGSSYCWKDPVTGRCDGWSGYTCPDSYTQFPAGVSEDLWNQTATVGGQTIRMNIRTWTIGVSDAIGPCELNYTAYRGRTDAAATDTGVQLDTNGNPVDTFLPPGAYDSSNQYFFVGTESSTLKAAFEAILAGAASGDYSTAAPVVSSAITGGGDVAYVASAQYPDWKGHFYAYDVHNPLSPVLNWDAGDKLTPAKRDLTQSAKARVIYTWTSSGVLIDLFSTPLNQISSKMTLPAGFNANVLDFLRGFDGSQSNAQRPWILGPVIQSTAAVIAAPDSWKGTVLPEHKSFEQTYAARHPLVFVGSSDGMLHFFDVADGYEVFAIMPPDQLANQVTLYQNYVASCHTVNGITRCGAVTGEPIQLSNHTYGIASSPRYGDAYISGAYKTLLLLTEGKGGSTIAALDITHTYPGRTGVVLPDASTKDYPADPNFSSSNQLALVWSKTPATLTGLGQTWSVPALGATSSTSPYGFVCVMGSGYSATSNPYAFELGLDNGAQKSLTPSSLGSASSSLVRNQAYGAGVLQNMTAKSSNPGDVNNLGVIADTHGRVWYVVPSSGTVVKALDVTGNQPIYYTPAVGYTSTKDVLAFASGNYYETSPAVTGASASFVPKVYVVIKNALATAADPVNDVWSMNLKDVVVDPTSNTKLHATSQVTADPVLFIPSSSGQPVKAYFLVYDPDTSDCAGTSYLLEVDATVTTGWKSSVTTKVSSLGSGIASGVAFTGGKIIISKSAVGAGKAGLAGGGPGPTPLGEAPALNGWIELK